MSILRKRELKVTYPRFHSSEELESRLKPGKYASRVPALNHYCMLPLKKKYIHTNKSGYDKYYGKIKEGKAVKEGDGRVSSMQEVREGFSEEQGDLKEGGRGRRTQWGRAIQAEESTSGKARGRPMPAVFREPQVGRCKRSRVSMW